MNKPWIVEGKFVPLTADQIKELEVDQLAAYTADLSKNALDETIASFNTKIEEAAKQNVSAEAYETFKTELQEKLDKIGLTAKEKLEIHTKHGELVTILKEQGITIKAMKASNSGMGEKEKKSFNALSRKKQFQLLLEKGMATAEYKAWADADMKGATIKMDAAKVTGETVDHTGPIFVTEPVDNVRDIPRMQAHMRDYIAVGSTDEANITFPEVYNYADIYTLGTQMLSENEEVTDVSFKSKEVTSNVARLGVSMNVSKRYFRGRSSIIIDHVLAQIPDALEFKEDVQVLFGDGSGNNLDGIVTDARKFDLTPTDFVAGNFTSIATWNNGTQTVVNFAIAHGLLSGDTLTLAATTGATYDGDHEEVILVDEKTLIINQAYTADAGVLANWTGTGKSYWYQSVEGAQEFDVLSAAASILEAGLYSANVAFVNSQTVKRMGTLKATDLQYVGVTRDAAGTLRIDKMPIVPMPSIPAGWYLIGDFSAKNIEIREYSTMSIQFLTDVTTEKQNSIVILADEEIHLVKYNPKWYIFDRFSTSKTQLEKP